VFAPLSIPSPPPGWQIPLTVPLGWLHSVIPAIPDNEVLIIQGAALVVIVAIAVGVFWGSRRLTVRGAEPGVIVDILIWTLPFAYLCARALYVGTHPADYADVGGNIIRYFWDGHASIFGGVVGGVVGALVGSRLAGLRFWSVADAIAPPLLLALAIGRFTDYFSQTGFGFPTDLPWGLVITSTNPALPVGLTAGTLFQPLFLYEMIWDVAGIVAILALEGATQWKRRATTGGMRLTRLAVVPRLQWGAVFAVFLVWYGLGRLLAESMTVGVFPVLAGIGLDQWFAVVLVVAGILVYLVQRRRHTGTVPSPYLPGHEWTPDGAIDSESTYTDTDEPGDEAAKVTTRRATSTARTTAS
jgi:prolipoprotein diacylglyceryl transferase